MGVERVAGRAGAEAPRAGIVKALLDTHFVVWIVTGASRLRDFPWIDRYRPWGVSPVSLLEIQFLAEIKRVEVQNPEFTETLAKDPRFVIDEISTLSLIRRAIDLTWTRDPFDRLITAHSSIRRLPLCTTDRNIRSFHRLLPPELAPGTDEAPPEG
jgi:PIN domain nuclease of toxin-antitoxin system